MNFREWLWLEMAMVSKQPIDISSPEVIERLKTVSVDSRFPYWTSALAGILGEIQQHIQNGEPAGQAVRSLMQRTRGAGIDPLQTRQINFSPNDKAIHWRSQRYMRKWIYQSIYNRETGQLLPNNFFDKKGEIIDRNSELGARLYQQARSKFDASQLVPNLQIGWNPNSMVPDENSYDDKKLEKNQLKQLSSQLGMANVPQLKQFVEDYARRMVEKRIQDQKVRQDLDVNQVIQETWNKFVMNLMRFNPAHPSPINVDKQSLRTFIWYTVNSITRRSTNRPQVIPMQQKPKKNPYMEPALAGAAG